MRTLRMLEDQRDNMDKMTVISGATHLSSSSSSSSFSVWNEGVLRDVFGVDEKDHSQNIVRLEGLAQLADTVDMWLDPILCLLHTIPSDCVAIRGGDADLMSMSSSSMSTPPPPFFVISISIKIFV